MDGNKLCTYHSLSAEPRNYEKHLPVCSVFYPSLHPLHNHRLCNRNVTDTSLYNQLLITLPNFNHLGCNFPLRVSATCGFYFSLPAVSENTREKYIVWPMFKKKMMANFSLKKSLVPCALEQGLQI